MQALMNCRALWLLLGVWVGTLLLQAGYALAQTVDETAPARKPWHVDLPAAENDDDAPPQPEPAPAPQPVATDQDSRAEPQSPEPSEPTPVIEDDAESDNTPGPTAAAMLQPGDGPAVIRSDYNTDRSDVAMLPDLSVLTASVSILRDPEGRLGIGDVSQPEFDDRFKPLTSSHIQLDEQSNPAWLRIRVDNPSSVEVTRSISAFESSIDRLILYAENPDGSFEISQAGRMVPRQQQHALYRFPAVSFTVPARSSRTVYVHTASSVSTGILLRSGDRDQIRRRFLLDGMLLGMFYGTLAAMLLYNLFLYLFVGLRNYLGYVAYLVMLFFCTFMLDGMDRLLTPWTFSAVDADMYGEIFGAFSLAALIEFSRRFMNLADRIPWANKMFLALSACAVALILPLVAVPEAGFRLTEGFTMVSLLVVLVCALTLRVRGDRPTRFFALSFGVLFLGVTMEVASHWLLSYGPGLTNSALLAALDICTTYGLRFGTGLEMVLLSLALADQINLLRQEKEAAQNEALQSLQHTADMKDAYSRRLERRVLERTQALEKAKEDAEAATLAKSRFLATISHEIRTPMTAILGFTQLLGDQNHTPEQQRDFIQTIERNGHHLLALINEILDLSKIEANQLQLHPEEISPVNLVNDVFSLMRVRSERAGLTLRANFQGKLPHQIFADDLRLRQILLNLVGNAIKFTESGSVELTVRIGPGDTNPDLLFTVTDTGVGMSSEQLGRLFQPFNQGDNSVTRKFGGTGLGLAISKRLAKMMDGDLTASSEEGEGSQFTLSIPMAPLNELKLYHPATSTLVAKPAKTSGGYKRQEPPAATSAATAEGVSANPAEHASVDVDQASGPASSGDITPSAEISAEVLSRSAAPFPASEQQASAPAGDSDNTIYINDEPLPQSPGDRPGATDSDISPNSRAHVLLAEDGVDNQRLISFYLKRVGIDVTLADNGQEAVDIAIQSLEGETHFDLILMDIQMPVLDGINATSILREAGYVGPIVALTAHAMKGDREQCLAAGCDDFATKPINRDDLLQKIEQYLAARA